MFFLELTNAVASDEKDEDIEEVVSCLLGNCVSSIMLMITLFLKEHGHENWSSNFTKEAVEGSAS